MICGRNSNHPMNSLFCGLNQRFLFNVDLLFEWRQSLKPCRRWVSRSFVSLWSRFTMRWGFVTEVSLHVHTDAVTRWNQHSHHQQVSDCQASPLALFHVMQSKWHLQNPVLRSTRLDTSHNFSLFILRSFTSQKYLKMNEIYVYLTIWLKLKDVFEVTFHLISKKFPLKLLWKLTTEHSPQELNVSSEFPVVENVTLHFDFGKFFQSIENQVENQTNNLWRFAFVFRWQPRFFLSLHDELTEICFQLVVFQLLNGMLRAINSDGDLWLFQIRFIYLCEISKARDYRRNWISLLVQLQNWL